MGTWGCLRGGGQWPATHCPAAAHSAARAAAAPQVRHFVHNKLGVSDRCMAMMTWAELLHKVVLVQRTTRLCITGCVVATALRGGLRKGVVGPWCSAPPACAPLGAFEYSTAALGGCAMWWGAGAVHYPACANTRGAGCMTGKPPPDPLPAARTVPAGTWMSTPL